MTRNQKIQLTFFSMDIELEEFNSKLEENNKQIFTIAVDTAMKQAKQYKSSS